jgi:hypothetical protein
MKNIITKMPWATVDRRELRDVENAVNILNKRLASAELEAITESLQHLIQNGLLKIELGKPELVALADSDELKVRNIVRVVCTQQERLDFLEKRNKELQEQIDQIKKIAE